MEYNLYVKRFDTNETVSTIAVNNPFGTIRGEYKYEVVMAGLLRQMDTDRFYVDDSEIPAEPSDD
jgi:hypothetical protein